MLLNNIKIFFLLILLFLFNSCSGFKPLYKENIAIINELQYFSIATDKKKISQKVKKSLLSILPINKKSKYIIKIEASSETSGTVSDTTRKITRYKIEVSAKVKIYLRGKKYDKLMYSFNESMSTPYSLILNNIRSTIASKNNAESTSIRLLSEEIYKRILIYLSNQQN
jgi:hypothetical protein